MKPKVGDIFMILGIVTKLLSKGFCLIIYCFKRRKEPSVYRVFPYTHKKLRPWGQGDQVLTKAPGGSTEV